MEVQEASASAPSTAETFENSAKNKTCEFDPSNSPERKKTTFLILHFFNLNVVPPTFWSRHQNLIYIELIT